MGQWDFDNSGNVLLAHQLATLAEAALNGDVESEYDYKAIEDFCDRLSRGTSFSDSGLRYPG